VPARACGPDEEDAAVKEDRVWLPNLVSGVPIWKLASDLNEPKFFDGRLLVPEVEGPGSLPTKVTWNLTGLVPLGTARDRYPKETQAATEDFMARLERVAGEFGNEASGYHKYKQAFTIPGLEADAGANYFFDPTKQRLVVTNWGATPRDITGFQDCIFGYESFEKLFAHYSARTRAADLGAERMREAIASGAADANVSAPAGPLSPRPWRRAWLALGALAALLLMVFFIHGCGNAGLASDAQDGAASAAPFDGPLDSMDASSDSALPLEAESASADEELSCRAPRGVWCARVDGGSSEASVAAIVRDHKDTAGSPASPARSGAGAATGAGPGSGSETGKSAAAAAADDEGERPRRIHFQPGATHWRVTGGADQLEPRAPLQGEGDTFVVTLRSHGHFDRLRVEWQDASGRWHE
jgi:hypothetical protein